MNFSSLFTAVVVVSLSFSLFVILCGWMRYHLLTFLRIFSFFPKKKHKKMQISRAEEKTLKKHYNEFYRNFSSTRTERITIKILKILFMFFHSTYNVIQKCNNYLKTQKKSIGDWTGDTLRRCLRSMFDHYMRMNGKEKKTLKLCNLALHHFDNLKGVDCWLILA